MRKRPSSHSTPAESKRRKKSHDSIQIATLAASKALSWDTISAAYEPTQALYIEKMVSPSQCSHLGHAQLAQLYKSHPSVIEKTWCVENGNKHLAAKDILGGQKRPRGKWYTSFIVQHKKAALDKVLKSAPLPMFPPQARRSRSHNSQRQMQHSDCVWFFLGQNSDKTQLMQGRPEHTDSVSHAGTWHMQLSGTKIWLLRPTEELLSLKTTSKSLTKNTTIRVECNPGDILLVNTRLWWHHTEIPCTKTARDQLSISYARDIFKPVQQNNKKASPNGMAETKCDMTNVDGRYATSAISKGNVVMTEEDLPDCELQMSEDPNCEVMEDQNGLSVLVAVRDIAEGEWLTIGCDSDSE